MPGHAVALDAWHETPFFSERERADVGGSLPLFTELPRRVLLGNLRCQGRM